MLVLNLTFQLRWDEEGADPCNRDCNEGDEPEDPRPVGEFDKDSTNNEAENYKSKLVSS